MRVRLAFLAPAALALSMIALAQDDAIQVGYASNLTAGDSFISVTNVGTQNFTNICVNTYTFAPGEQLVSCCSCVVTPNEFASLSVQRDLISNTLTAVVPASVTVMLLATSSATCNAATPTTTSLASGMRAWGTTIHAAPGGGFQTTETKLLKAGLSAQELTRITSLCGFIQATGSGFGICKPCASGTPIIPPLEAAPTLISPANVSSGVSLTPTMSWSTVTGATSYDIYLGDSSDPPFVANTVLTSYAPGPLTGGTTYDWRVVAKNAVGDGPGTATWSFTTASRTVPGDFDGNGVPDLIWQNDSTRQVVVWYMGGAQGNTYLSSNPLSGSIPGWTVVGAADFNGDSKPDLVWQNDTSRQVVLWYMGGVQGNTYLGSNWLSSADVPGWRAMARY